MFRAARDSVVDFEADRPFDHDGGGWSVNVTGVAREVTDPAELVQLRALPLRQWEQAGSERSVRISVDLLSGRRVVPASV